MLKYSEINKVHLELSSYCNAYCPGCPRNFHGVKHNAGYKENNLSLDNIKQIFNNGFLEQIQKIRINGNFGDFVMNPDSVEIIKWLKSNKSDLEIIISTNGSAQKREFWESLGKLNVTIIFAIDGFSGTHELYRRGTNFNKVIENAKYFIKAGGDAICQFILFDFNIKEKELLKKHVLSIGFTQFKIINNTRGYLPVFNNNKEKVIDIDFSNKHHLKNETKYSYDELVKVKQNINVLLSDITPHINTDIIDCEIKRSKEIYISSLGDVYPCCYLGFEPKTFKTSYHTASHNQYNKHITNNNAIENDIKKCIKWFSYIEKNMNKETFEEGRLVLCQYTCGGRQYE